jgi:hypothetical protein
MADSGPGGRAEALRLGAPDDAQDASYLAASARMRSLRASFSSIERKMNAAA